MKSLWCITQVPGALAWACGLWVGGYGPVAGELNPVLNGSWPGFTRASAMDVAISSNYAFVTTSGGVGLAVFDLSNPRSPQQVGRLDIDGCMNCVAHVVVAGQFAYCTSISGLHVIDIAKPASPRRVGGYEEYGWRAKNVAVSGDFAYVTGGRLNDTVFSLQVFDVSSPLECRRMGSCASRKEGGRLVVSGNYAYVTEAEYDNATHAYRGGIEVFDVSNPADPKSAGWFDAGGRVSSASCIALSGNIVYVTGPICLQVIDISDPTHPKQVGIDCSGFGNGMFLLGRYAYVVAFGSLAVIDVFNPALPHRVGGFDSGSIFPVTGGVAASGDFAYVAVGDAYSRGGDAGLQVIDISNPVIPRHLGVNDTNGRTVDVARSENYAYLAEGYAGLKVIDVSDAASPRRIGQYHAMMPVEAVAISGKYAYLTESSLNDGGQWVYRLEVVDVSIPDDPKHLSWYDSEDWFGKIVLSANYGYMVGVDGMQVIDISQPASPRRVGQYESAQDLVASMVSQSMAVAGGHAYVVNRERGLEIVDVSSPAILRKVSEYKTEHLAGPVAVSGALAFLADVEREYCCNQSGLQVIDVSDPSGPLLLGRCRITDDYSGFWPYAISLAGELVYLVLMEGGFGDQGRLVVIDISVPSHPRQVGGHAFAHANGVAALGNQVHLANGPEGLLVLEMLPFFRSIVKARENLELSWEGFGLARLQRATRLSPPDWRDLPGVEGASHATVPIDDANAFFRLIQP